MAGLSHVSLVVHLDDPKYFPMMEPRYLEKSSSGLSVMSAMDGAVAIDGIPAPEVQFAFHETLHLWQQITHGFLVRLAQEDWDRLRTFEKSSNISEPGPLRMEYITRDKDVNFSVQDLHECVTRYGELETFRDLLAAWRVRSPNHWLYGSKEQIESHIRTIEPNLRIRLTSYLSRSDGQGFRPNADTEAIDLEDDVAFGRYGTPFRWLREQIGSEICWSVFPFIAHFALQSEHPIRFLQHFADPASSIVRHWRTAGGHPSRSLRLFDVAPLHLPLRSAADITHVKLFGGPLEFGIERARSGSLAEHPGYDYLSDRYVTMEKNFDELVSVINSNRDLREMMLSRQISILDQTDAILQTYDTTARAAIQKMGDSELDGRETPGVNENKPDSPEELPFFLKAIRRPRCGKGHAFIDERAFAERLRQAEWEPITVSSRIMADFILARPTVSEFYGLLNHALTPPCFIGPDGKAHPGTTRIVPWGGHLHSMNLPSPTPESYKIAEKCAIIHERWGAFRRTLRGF